MATMDSLHQRIAAKEREVVDLQQRLDKAKLELRVFKEADALRPSGVDAALIHPDGGMTLFETKTAPASNGHAKRRGGGGRKKGEISMQWRATLGKMASGGNEPKPPIIIANIAGENGHTLTLHETRERMRAYVKTGLVEKVDGSYRVSQEAIERFGLMK